MNTNTLAAGCAALCMALICGIAAGAQPSGKAYETVAGSDWKEYKTTADLRAARRFWWFAKDKDANDFVDIVPDPAFGQVGRITFAQNSGGAGGAPRMMVKLPQPLEKMWFRFRVKFSPGFTTRGEEPAGHANSYKLAFWLWDGFEGRGQIEFSNTRQYILGCSWGLPDKRFAIEEKPLPASQNFGHVTTEWEDGEWYEFVVCFEKVSPNTARQHWWRRRLTEKNAIIDLPFIYTGAERIGQPIPRVRAVELGANKNKNNPTTMYLHWGPYEVVDGARFEDPFGMRKR